MIIGMISRLINEKGYGDAIKAAPAILNVNTHVWFVIIGQGRDRADLENSAGELGFADKIKFLSFRNDADRLFYGIDIFVQPTWTECHKPFGLVLVEAMVHRILVIASDIGPFREMLLGGKSGLLFKEKDPEGMAKKVIMLLQNKGLAGMIAKNGLEMARNRCDCKTMAGQTTKPYEIILQKKGYRLNLI